MPVHDWTRVDAGTLHAFHQAWITHLMESLNGGLLPEGYYAMGEQIASGREPDVLALHLPSAKPLGDSKGLAVAERVPKVRVRLRPDENARSVLSPILHPRTACSRSLRTKVRQSDRKPTSNPWQSAKY